MCGEVKDTRRKSCLSHFFVLALVFVGVASVHGEGNIMPGELVEFAQENNCSQLSDFYDKHYGGPVNPPYVYGYGGRQVGNSFNAVFWCRKSKSPTEAYFLLFMFKYSPPDELSSCPDIIEWPTPGGLSIYRNRTETLKGFRYLKNPKKKAPEHVRLSHDAILSEEDGTEHLFYCHKGEWLVRTQFDE